MSEEEDEEDEEDEEMGGFKREIYQPHSKGWGTILHFILISVLTNDFV